MNFFPVSGNITIIFISQIPFLYAFCFPAKTLCDLVMTHVHVSTEHV